MRYRLNRIILLTACIFIYGILSFAPAAATLQTLQKGMDAPDFSLTTINGGRRSFSEVKGEKLTVLIFWSTWSEKSGRILARMEHLHGKYKNQGLAVVGINVDGQNSSVETTKEIKAFVGERNVSFPVLVDQGLATFHDYGVVAVPSTVIADGDRKILYELSGYPLVGAEAMIDFIASVMEGERAASGKIKAGYQPNRNAVRYYQMGMTTMKKSKRMADSAEIWFRKAIEADPSFVLPHLGLGAIYLHRNNTALAKKAFQEALAKEPGHPVALCELGMILLDEGRGPEGSSLFEQALKADESYAPCYYYSAYAQGKEGRLEEATRLFREAEKMNPFDYRNFVYQGRMYAARKEFQHAVDGYKKALEIILQSQ